MRLPHPPEACPIIGLVDEAPDEQSAIEELTKVLENQRGRLIAQRRD
jgi:hypothetical protein